MKNIVLTFVLCLLTAIPAFAQNNMEGMRFLTINALVQYGEKLYDRGDFNEAYAVFNHVLTFDNHQKQALEYLKEMGRPPAPIPSFIEVSGPQVDHKSQGIHSVVPTHSILLIRKLDEPGNTVDVLNTESLMKAIEAKKQVIEKLRAQVMQMRESLASQSAQ